MFSFTQYWSDMIDIGLETGMYQIVFENDKPITVLNQIQLHTHAAMYEFWDDGVFIGK